MKNRRVACIVGARPNFMKIAPILSEMEKRHGFAPRLIHTGQHFSPDMSDAFFRDLGIRAPEVSLGIGGGTSNEQVARVMLALEPVLVEERPDLVLVVGDVNATVAASLVSAKNGFPLAHVEAGLRSFDRTMPEEINRVVTDSLSDFLFTTESSAGENLRREGIECSRIFFVGNVMIDTLLRFRHQADACPVLDRLGLDRNNYVVVTLHRPANVDDPIKFGQLFQMLESLAEHLPVVFPMHPRTRNAMISGGWKTKRVMVVPPQGYIEFLRIMSDARMMLTDSGGIQEETTILGVPCLTIRDNTERPITITHGTNRLVGTDPPDVLKAAEDCLHSPARVPRTPDLWDGHAAHRIADILEMLLPE